MRHVTFLRMRHMPLWRAPITPNHPPPTQGVTSKVATAAQPGSSPKPIATESTRKSPKKPKTQRKQQKQEQLPVSSTPVNVTVPKIDSTSATAQTAVPYNQPATPAPSPSSTAVTPLVTEASVVRQGTTGLSDTRETTSFYNKFSYSGEELVPIDPPHLLVELLPFQKMGVGWMLQRERYHTGGIMADHLGMGKTVQMIGLCLAAGEHALVAATAAKAKEIEEKKSRKVEGHRLLTVVRQMQRIAVLQNCSKLTQPAMGLEALGELIENLIKEKKFDFETPHQEVMKWLAFAGRYHPAYRRKAEAFLRTEISSVFDDYNTPELRTLVVVPAALLLQWKSEIEKKITKDRNITVFLYHGDNKRVSVTELETFDFVLTTYDTLSNGIANLIIDNIDDTAFNRDDAGPLLRAKWKRCILDEAHVVRNPKTARWKAIKQITARKKWAVTATPLHNGIDDIQNLLEFIDSPTIPLLPDRNDVEAVLRDEVLQRAIADCLQPVFLRRGPVMYVDNKRTVLVNLPEKEEMVKTASLTHEETEQYNEILHRSRAALEESMEKKVFHVFAMMTRLRQCCCHPAINQGRFVQIYLCGVCKSEAANAVITKCGHAFCHECIMSRFRLESDVDGENQGLAVRAPCPVCDTPVMLASITGARHITSREHIQKLKSVPWVSSTKIDMILHEIAHVKENFPDDKIVIFSHFTLFLDVISVALDKHGVDFVRVDGSMPIRERNQIVQLFGTHKTTKVMLASKTAVGVGLNLTMANHVLVVDPWWNPAIEEQAIHRCHRIGQTKKVFVKRFVTEGTIEQYCFEICQRKKEFGDSILRAATGGDVSASQKAQSKMVELVKRLQDAPPVPSS